MQTERDKEFFAELALGHPIENKRQSAAFRKEQAWFGHAADSITERLNALIHSGFCAEAISAKVFWLAKTLTRKEGEEGFERDVVYGQKIELHLLVEHIAEKKKENFGLEEPTQEEYDYKMLKMRAMMGSGGHQAREKEASEVFFASTDKESFFAKSKWLRALGLHEMANERLARSAIKSLALIDARWGKESGNTSINAIGKWRLEKELRDAIEESQTKPAKEPCARAVRL